MLRPVACAPLAISRKRTPSGASSLKGQEPKATREQARGSHVLVAPSSQREAPTTPKSKNHHRYHHIIKSPLTEHLLCAGTHSTSYFRDYSLLCTTPEDSPVHLLQVKEVDVGEINHDSCTAVWSSG